MGLRFFNLKICFRDMKHLKLSTSVPVLPVGSRYTLDSFLYAVEMCDELQRLKFKYFTILMLYFCCN